MKRMGSVLMVVALLVGCSPGNRLDTTPAGITAKVAQSGFSPDLPKAAKQGQIHPSITSGTQYHPITQLLQDAKAEIKPLLEKSITSYQVSVQQLDLIPTTRPTLIQFGAVESVTNAGLKKRFLVSGTYDYINKKLKTNVIERIDYTEDWTKWPVQPTDSPEILKAANQAVKLLSNLNAFKNMGYSLGSVESALSHTEPGKGSGYWLYLVLNGKKPETGIELRVTLVEDVQGNFRLEHVFSDDDDFPTTYFDWPLQIER